MNAHTAIRINLDLAAFVGLAYVNDLTDEQLLIRPTTGTNHIAWQLGHLIRSEHDHMESIAPGRMPPLPEGFAARYTKETAVLDDADCFDSKSALLAAFETQRAGTLAVMDTFREDDLDRETGVDYAPTIGALLSLQGSHWMMHSGQWVIVRRMLGKPALF